MEETHRGYICLLRGLWICEYRSSSPPLSILSLLPPLGPAQHLLHAVGAGQGRVS
ncbi:hypothetical protein PAMP_003274 [Pampus punctatissimus]